MRAAELIDRKQVLAELLADATPPLMLSEYLEAQGLEVFARACEMELEGIVSKRADGRYRSGRSDLWLKTTCRHCETFVVAGWAEKRGKFDGPYLGREEGGALTAGLVASVARPGATAGLANFWQETRIPARGGTQSSPVANQGQRGQRLDVGYARGPGNGARHRARGTQQVARPRAVSPSRRRSGRATARRP
jgi:hypothetical protein